MRLFKLLSIVGLIALVFAAGLSGKQAAVRADGGTTYIVIGGASAGPAQAYLFAPTKLQVHKGDTVRWMLDGFHNVHFHTDTVELFIKSDVDGKQVTQFNPKVVWGTIKKGDTYMGGDANSGLGFDNPQALMPYFELKIDAAPGSYNYYCDVHPGMAGIIEVVDDATKIPSPVDVVSDGFAETQKVLGAGFGLQADLSKKASEAKVEGDTITVMLGSKAGQTAIGGLFPGVVVIKPGQKVTWTLPQEAVGLLTAVGSLPLPNMQESMNMIPPSGDRKVPIIALTDLMVSGAPKTSSAVGLKDKWFSGVLNPGSSYTLTFTEPGVYKYGALTSNGDGAVVVLP